MQGLTSAGAGAGSVDNYPDSVCCQLSADSSKLTCVYSDRSLFIWDIKNPKKVGKYRSFLGHSGCVWDVDVCPDTLPGSATGSTAMDLEQRPPFPPGTFVTCSSDSTIRFWNLNGAGSDTKRNMFSKELLRTIFVGEDFSTMKARRYDIGRSHWWNNSLHSQQALTTLTSFSRR